MSESKLPKGKRSDKALEMYLRADFDRDGTAEVDGITLLKEEDGMVEFIDYSESLTDPESVTYRIQMVRVS